MFPYVVCKCSLDFLVVVIQFKMTQSCLKLMNSVLSVFTQRPMSLVTGSRQCSRDSTREGIFTRSAWIIFVVCIQISFCRISLASSHFFLVFNHLLSLDLLMFVVYNVGMFLIKYGVNRSCKTPVIMSKKSLSPSVYWTTDFIVLDSTIIAVTVSVGRPFARRTGCLKIDATH